MPYGLGDLEADLASGHNVVDTVFVECGASYDRSADDAFAPIGETVYVAGEAERSGRQVMGGIVAHADLTDAANLDAVLDAHEAAGHGRFRGIRHAGSHALHPEVLTIPGRAPAGLYADAAFRAGVARLGERGLSYDTWHYHYQNRDFLDLARNVPGTTHRARSLRHAARCRTLRVADANTSSSSGRPTSPRSPAARTSSPRSAGWRCPTTASAGTPPIARRRPTSSSRPRGATTCTRSSSSGPNGACSSRTSRSTGCRCRTARSGTPPRSSSPTSRADERDAMLRGTAARVYRLDRLMLR